MTKWIRWQGLAAFVVIVLLFALIWLVVVDWIAEKAIETAGTRAVGAKVDVAKADVTLFPAGIGVYGLAVTNPDKPMTNSFEINYLNAALELPALIQRKLIVDDLRIQGLQFNTARKYSGAVNRKSKKSPSSKGTDAKSKSWLDELCNTGGLPLLSLPKVEDILDREPLQSVKKIQELETKIETAQADWQKKLDNLPNQKDLNAYQARAKKIKKSSGGLSGLLGSATEAQSLYKDLQKDLKQIENAQKQFKSELKTLQKDTSGLSKLPGEELNRIMSKYSFSADGAANWSRLLFGRNLCGWWQKAYHWYQRVSPYLHRLPSTSKEPETKQPVRSKGLDVKFQEQNPKPDLLVRNTHIDAELEAGKFTGEIKNITSDPKLVGTPLTFKFLGRKLQRINDINLSGALNFIQPELPQHTVKMVVIGYQVRDLVIGADDLDIAIKQAAANIKLDYELNGEVTNTQFAAQMDKLQFSKDKPDSSTLASTLFEAIRKTQNIKLTASVTGKDPSYKTSLNSNLEKVLQNATGDLLKGEAAKLESKLRAGIGDQLKTPIKDAQARLTQLDRIADEFAKRNDLGAKILEQIKLPI